MDKSRFIELRKHGFFAFYLDFITKYMKEAVPQSTRTLFRTYQFFLEQNAGLL